MSSVLRSLLNATWDPSTHAPDARRAPDAPYRAVFLVERNQHVTSGPPRDAKSRAAPTAARWRPDRPPDRAGARESLCPGRATEDDRPRRRSSRAGPLRNSTRPTGGAGAWPPAG